MPGSQTLPPRGRIRPACCRAGMNALCLLSHGTGVSCSQQPVARSRILQSAVWIAGNRDVQAVQPKSRQHPRDSDSTYTFVQCGKRSVLNHSIVDKELDEAGALSDVMNPDMWAIADSGHCIIGATVPLLVDQVPKERPKAFHRWHLEAFLERQGRTARKRSCTIKSS